VIASRVHAGARLPRHASFGRYCSWLRAPVPVGATGRPCIGCLDCCNVHTLPEPYPARPAFRTLGRDHRRPPRRHPAGVPSPRVRSQRLHTGPRRPGRAPVDAGNAPDAASSAPPAKSGSAPATIRCGRTRCGRDCTTGRPACSGRHGYPALHPAATPADRTAPAPCGAFHVR